MATCRDVCTDALTALKAIAPGDWLQVDELASGLTALQQLLLEWHAARGPMIDVDISADYTAGPDQRIRVQNGAMVTVTLPNSAPLFVTWDPYDYGFVATPDQPAAGSTGSADGYNYRQPRDGERVEIVGQGAQALYFYTADTNAWASVYGLALDSALPINSRHIGHWGARVAERLVDSWPALFEPTPSLAKRIVAANSALLIRPGVTRDPVVAQYF